MSSPVFPFTARNSSWPTRRPTTARAAHRLSGFTTGRIALFADDPVSAHKRAVATGAIERNPVVEHEHQTIGPATTNVARRRWQTRLVTSGLLESSSTNNRARIPPPHVLQISSATRPLASSGRHLISICKAVVPTWERFESWFVSSETLASECVGYKPNTVTSSRTEAEDFCRAAFSSAVNLISTICSTPFAPSFTGTPTKSPLMPYSPSR